MYSTSGRLNKTACFRLHPEYTRAKLLVSKGQMKSISTFANQSLLKRLPIPTLENLKEKYLASCKPILDSKQYENTQKIVDEFLGEGGFGKVLQERLIEHDKTQKNSWLETIWLQKAYLEWREPSMINVNWWCQFKDHPQQSKHLLIHPPPPNVFSAWQIERAAGLISNLLDFNDKLNAETLQPEFIKDTPICMNQYKNIFGTHRNPGEKSDYLTHQYPCLSKHIIVLAKNQIFKVNVIHNDGKRVKVKEIQRLLHAVGKEVLIDYQQPSIGLFTAGHRDTWFKGYSKLCELSERNKENFETIKTALFAVCLDDYSTRKNIDQSLTQIFHNGNATNRWFDKALQIIVASNGRAGLNGEHSPSDAVVPGKVVDYIIENEPAVDPEGAIDEFLPYPVRLEWKVDQEVTDLLSESQNVAKALIDDTESCLLQTDYYGSKFMKEVAQTSPDAFVQICLQLAYYRLHKSVTPVYESASTRLFKHGRTETGRSMSAESLEFIETFDNDDILYAKKREMYRAAIKAQTTWMKDAAFGKGIDRHMLGLRCMIKEGEIEKATMFTDKSYIDTMTFNLSTSNMSPGKNFYGGFGPVTPDGYGINYAIDKYNLKFSISAKKSSSKTNVYRFKDELMKVFRDICILFPKRSEIWGYGWREKQELERKEDAQFLRMQKLSNDYLEKQKKLLEKYENE